MMKLDGEVTGLRGLLASTKNPLVRKAILARLTSGSQKVSSKRSIALGTWKNPGVHGAYTQAPSRGTSVSGTGVPVGT